ncbi:hypothetical protein [Nocardioides sp. L-11A]|uniref:hypothetical protein n=1 Tax=Nocardioides sp. L-11A TaxID=3043848 RepID=UPI00249ACB00|nr:hypothetical protein QJ852_00940 [Nocardioides sp. L-11A]
MFRDVVHGGCRPRWRQVVEVDGRLFHDSSAARDRDLERDLDTALGGTDTVRLGYGQVLARPCATAVKLVRLFQLRGREGRPTSCPGCSDPDRSRSEHRAGDQSGPNHGTDMMSSTGCTTPAVESREQCR